MFRKLELFKKLNQTWERVIRTFDAAPVEVETAPVDAAHRVRRSPFDVTGLNLIAAPQGHAAMPRPRWRGISVQHGSR